MHKLIACASLFSFVAAAAQAKEYYVGGPDYHADMEIVSSFLLGVEMSPTPPNMVMGPDTIHLEVDLHATANNRWGYPDQAWIPYVKISYILTKEGSSWSHKGVLLPMSANDGPHYAESLTMDGPGKYHVVYTFQPPSVSGYYRHKDAATGIPPWWKPFTEDFSFNYPAKS